MTDGLVESEIPGKKLRSLAPEESMQDADSVDQEESPPLAPAVVLFLAAVAIGVLGVKPWQQLFDVQPSDQPNTLAESQTAADSESRQAPMRLAGNSLRKQNSRAQSLAGLSVSSEPEIPLPPMRPPSSFEVAAYSPVVFGEVQSTQWLEPETRFPQMMVASLHQNHSTDWKPMISWRKTSSGESMLPVARVRCGGLSPQSVARRADKFDRLIGQLAAKYSVDENLVKAIITRESCFDQAAVSHVGAIGLMQLMPATAQWLKVKNPAKAESNLAGGVKYFASLHKEFGSLELALAAYNAGPGNVRRYGGIPPFRETQSYVKTVLGFYRRYSAADQFVSS